MCIRDSFKATSPEEKKRVHKFGDKTLPGIFLYYTQHKGGNWDRSYVIIDEELMLNASSLHEVEPKRYQDVLPPEPTVVFPVARGEVVEPPSDVRRSRQSRRRPIWPDDDAGGAEGEPHNERSSSSDAGPRDRTKPHASEADPPADPADPDYWTIQGDMLIRHHVRERTQLYQPSELDGCPIPLKYLDVMREIKTNSDVADEALIRDIWDPKVTDERTLFQPWTGVTRFDILREKPPKGYYWSNGRPTRIQDWGKRPDYIWPEIWQSMSKPRQRKDCLLYTSPSPRDS